MATYEWSIPTGKEITGSTYIKDTDNNISDTIDDLVDFVNGEGAHLNEGLTYDLVDKASAQVIDGVKTFTNGSIGDITGNSDTTTALATPIDVSAEGDIVVDAISFDGSSNLVLSASFRTGMIMMWSGAVVDIPSGWYLCDGTNSTPNLLGRAVIAAGGDYSVGDSGAGTIPSHTHVADHNHTATFSGSALPSHSHPYVKFLTNSSVQSSLSATYGVTETGTTSSTSGASAGTPSGSVNVATKALTTEAEGTGTDVIPKYYALCYIMKG